MPGLVFIVSDLVDWRGRAKALAREGESLQQRDELDAPPCCCLMNSSSILVHGGVRECVDLDEGVLGVERRIVHLVRSPVELEAGRCHSYGRVAQQRCRPTIDRQGRKVPGQSALSDPASTVSRDREE